jgi:hypothetical protein
MELRKTEEHRLDPGKMFTMIVPSNVELAGLRFA